MTYTKVGGSARINGKKKQRRTNYQPPISRSKTHVWKLSPGQTRPKCEQCGLVWEAGSRKPKGKCEVVNDGE